MPSPDAPPPVPDEDAFAPFDLVAIDLDGTLADTVADLHAATVRMQEGLGLERAPLEAVRGWVGNGVERLVHRALTGAMERDAPPDLFAAALPRFLVAYEACNGTAATLYPGVERGLERLAALGTPLACVTNKAGRFSRPLLEALGIAGRFAYHVAGDDVPAKKPDPAALHEAARLAGVAPSSSVLVGDSVSDIRAARAASFGIVAVSYGYNHGRPVRRLRGAERPDAVVDSLEELPELFARLEGRGRAD